MQDLKTWRCGHCPYTIVLPTEHDASKLYIDVLIRIREHRFGHLVSALESESDDDILRLCGDEPVSSDPTGPILPEDKALIMAGIEGLLRDDLPRAKRVWYSINEDGSFNR